MIEDNLTGTPENARGKGRSLSLNDRSEMETPIGTDSTGVEVPKRGGSRPIRLRYDHRRSKKRVKTSQLWHGRRLFFQKSRPSIIGTGRARAIASILRPDRLGSENSTSEWTMDTRIAVMGKCVVASLSYSRSLRQGRDYPLPDPVRWGEIIKWSLIGWHKNSMAEP